MSRTTVRNGSGAACRDTSRVFRIGNLLCWFDRLQRPKAGYLEIQKNEKIDCDISCICNLRRICRWS